MDNWGHKIISPRPTSPPKAHIRYPCPGLCRFFGLVTFLAVAAGVYYGGSAWLDLPPLDFRAPAWTTSRIVLIAVSTLLAMVGSLLAFAYTMSIDVVSEELSDFFIVLWQFLANGGLAWFMLIGIAMSISLGRDGAKAAVLQFGAERATVHVIATGSIVSLLVGLAFFASSRFRLPFIVFLAFTETVSLLAAHWHFVIYGIDGRSWILAGLITPILLLISAPSMIERDRRQRHLAIEQFATGSHPHV